MMRTTGASGALVAGLLGLALSWGLAWILPRPAAGNSDGPLAGFTGGFGEPTCRSCHFDSPAEPEAGELVLEGVPETYEPGAEYPLTVVLRDPRLERAGFQLAARFAGQGAGGRPDRGGAGRQAGRLLVPSPRTGSGTGSGEGARLEVVEHGDPPVLYARQLLAGTSATAARGASWSLRWAAPEEAAGPVVFHAAANAANYDDSEFGDVVHTATARSEPAR